jgi:hypothetical protein
MQDGMVNLHFAWAGILLGAVAGAVQGLFFHDEDWLGGYGSWRRRMLRLGHISFFGIAIINVAFFLTLNALGIHEGHEVSSLLLVIAVFTMPLLCYLSAFRKAFRHLFFIPTLSVIVAVALLLWSLLVR